MADAFDPDEFLSGVVVVVPRKVQIHELVQAGNALLGDDD